MKKRFLNWQNIYKKYGYTCEKTVSFTLPGKDGMEEMAKLLKNVRNNPPSEVDGKKVISMWDYQSQVITNADGSTDNIEGLPKSNVLYYDLEDDAWCCVRPSGTEPKVKFYMGVKGKSLEDADAKLDLLKKSMMELSE